MQVKTLCNNAIVVSHDDVDYLFSYDSLQAYHVHGTRGVAAKPKVSKTTSKHINLFAQYAGCTDNVIIVDTESFYEGIE